MVETGRLPSYKRHAFCKYRSELDLVQMKDKRPHICFVALNAYPLLASDDRHEVIGGAELQQVLVAKLLVQQNYSVSMICLNFGQRDDEVIDGIRIFRAYSPKAGIPGVRFIWPRLLSVWRCLRRADADIYYQRTAGVLTGVVAVFARRYGKKSIFAAAGNPDLERPTPRIRFSRDRWIYEYGVRHVDRVLVQNQEQRRLCRLNYGRDAQYLPNLYPVLPHGPRHEGIRILWVSTIRRIKRPELCLDLAEALPQYRFRMIGGVCPGEEELFMKIRERSRGIPNLEFLGFVPYPESDREFEDASLFLNTSESEGFPNTFLQAWARGIPTVSFVDCGARKDGRVVGLVVKSIEEMTGAIARLAEDQDAREREGRLCLDYFKEHHAPEQVLGFYEAIIRELSDLGGGRATETA